MKTTASNDLSHQPASACSFSGRLWLFLLLGLLACAGEKSAEKVVVPSAARLQLSADTIMAGSNCRITAEVAATALDSNWQLVWSNAFGDVVIPGRAVDVLIHFTVPEHKLQKSGRHELALVRAGQVVDQKSLHILPGPPLDVMESYAGNKTMVAAGRQKAMVITIPKDTFDNPVQPGTPVSYQLRYPGAAVRVEEVPVEQLVSGIELPAGEQSGKIIIGASSGQARSVEETVMLTPGWPEAFTLQIQHWFPYADSRQNIELYTGFIRDATGNLVADGTAVIFQLMQQRKQVGVYRSFTSNGVARVHIENPDRAGVWDIQARIEGGILSDVLQLSFETYVTALPFQYESERHRIIAGPISAKLGQIVTDDLPVDVLLEGTDSSYVLEGLTENGFCSVTLPAGMLSGSYHCTVSAGGKTNSQKIEIIGTTFAKQ